MLGSSPSPARSAFTFTELVAVLAVTAIMGAAGHSAYRTSAVRAQVAEGIAAARGLAPFVARAFRRTHDVPPDELLAPATAAMTHGELAVLSVEDGRIDIVFAKRADPAIAGRHVSLTPYESAALEIVWICGNETPGPGLNPLGFSAGSRQSAPRAATVDERYLPGECR